MSEFGFPLNQIPQQYQKFAEGMLNTYDTNHFNVTPTAVLTPEIAYETLNLQGDAFSTSTDFELLVAGNPYFAQPDEEASKQQRKNFFDTEQKKYEGLVNHLRKWQEFKTVIGPFLTKDSESDQSIEEGEEGETLAEIMTKYRYHLFTESEVYNLAFYIKDFLFSYKCIDESNSDSKLESANYREMARTILENYTSRGETVDIDSIKKMISFFKMTNYCDGRTDTDNPIYYHLDRYLKENKNIQKTLDFTWGNIKNTPSWKHLNEQDQIDLAGYFIFFYEAWDGNFEKKLLESGEFFY